MSALRAPGRFAPRDFEAFVDASREKLDFPFSTLRSKDGPIIMTEAARVLTSRPHMRNDHRTDVKDHTHRGEDLDVLPRMTAHSATPLWNLTPQQWRVFLLVGKALSNKAIAHELRVAESTVKAHVSAIFKMAGCRNRTEAALLSQRVRYGLLDADDDAPLPFERRK